MSAPGLFYADRDQWLSLPEWSSFFIDLGCAVADALPALEHRLVIGLALPTRAYAAALTAVGLVVGSDNDVDLDEHFARLSTLSPGASVSWRKHNVWYPAHFLRTATDEEGQPCVWLETDNHGLQERVRKGAVGDIQVCQSGRFRLGRKRAREITVNEVFLARWLGGADPSEYAMHTTYDCAILGQLNVLRREITEPGFGVRATPSRIVKGALQDILRVRRFVPRGEGYRAVVVPVTAQRHVMNAARERGGGRLVIFDGAASFLRWRDYFRGAHWLVVLDRTESGFREAAAQLNRECAGRACDGGIGDVIPPPGVELMVYQEAR